MPFNRPYDDVYLDKLLLNAINSWDDTKPRRWLARYGGLDVFGGGCSDTVKVYKKLQLKATMLSRRHKRSESTHSLPDIIYPNW